MSIAWLVLSPLSAAGLSPCECPHTESDTPTLKGANCCQSGTASHCCISVQTAEQGTATMIPAAGNPSLPQPSTVELWDALPPIAAVVRKLPGAPRSESPPDWLGPESSLYQCWLI
jgi:hypothetical protein